ncbi:TetR/AcrR family transcriptional regulator [Mucilaginibacter sp. cycad4]|uniref:TetR/AcrR family transcriptional regulator n=1 Tax=Mucilaginibacter sp. cycad4 TaxID=3342096 RepID=UPI002AAB76F8|nr:TetR/AcrR family transcriptional regulator [Mucilaginibacter gossypii]WPV01126.1 TetR/AcrR family transcriptional regulator [Mucilaginibacter gossypii]
MTITAETTTEEKILNAARQIFTKKGFLATTVRDIATEANTNVASVNYYFRSKENLFAFIMDETIKKLFDKIGPVLNDESTTAIEKIEICVGYYIDQLLENPDFPFFMVNEVLAGQTTLPMIEKVKTLTDSVFAKQLYTLQADGVIKFHPVNLMWNIAGMIVFPFLVRPKQLQAGYFDDTEFETMIKERKKLIPVWIGQVLEGKQ